MWTFLGKKYDLNLKFSKIIQDLFGYGKHHAFEVCCELGVNPKIKLKDLKLKLEHYNYGNKNFQNELEFFVKNNKEYLYGTNLKSKLNENLEKIKKIRNRRGNRLILKLPVRGQRTQTNAKTAKKMKGFF